MQSPSTDPRPTFVLAYDPLCGWCFGFGPALNALRARLKDEAVIEVAMGGLVTGARERPIAHDAPYIMRGLHAVHERTGVKAGPAFFERVLEPMTWVSRSEPACRTVRLVRESAGPEAALDVAQGLCEALYVAGRTPDDPATVRSVARRAGLDPDALLARWSAPEAEAETRAMFERERARGIASYPALFLRRGGDLVPVFEGCVPPDQAVAAAQVALNLTP